MASLRVKLKTGRASSSASSTSSTSSRRPRGTSCAECRSKRRRCNHAPAKEVIDISDDDEVEEKEEEEVKTVQRRKARRIVDSDDEGEDDLPSTATSTSRSAAPVVLNPGEEDEITPAPKPVSTKSKALRPPADPLGATVDEVAAWDAQQLIASGHRLALLIKLLLWSGADKRYLIKQCLARVKRRINFREKGEDALTMIQVGQTGADEETKVILLCARLYLSYSLLDIRPCAGKTMHVPWQNVRDPSQVDLFSAMLETILRRNDSKLFTSSNASQLEESSRAKPSTEAPDGQGNDPVHDATFHVPAREAEPRQQSEAQSEQTELSGPSTKDRATTFADISDTTTPTPPTMAAQTPPTAAEMHIATIMSVAKCTEDEAKQYLDAADGDLQQAVLKSLTPVATVAAAEKPREPTLIDDALEAYAAKLQALKVRDKGGDVLILLEKLSACRVHSGDLIDASSAFASLLTLDAGRSPGRRGIRHLLTVAANTAEGPPILARLDIEAPRIPIEQTADRESAEEHAHSKVKLENGEIPPLLDALPHSDWISAYESLIRMIANFPAKYHGLPQDIDAALPKIELIAKVAERYSAVSPESPVTRELERLFSNFINTHQLWKAIAQDAARWLVLSVRLQSTLIYNEAFVHVAGAYPAWPWVGVSEATLRTELPHVYQAIVTRSRELAFGRQAAERMLLYTTITGTPKSGPNRGKAVPVHQRLRHITYSVVNIWRDWITSHLSHLDSGYTTKPDYEDPLCKHDGECLSTAGFLRTIGRGGDAYLPSEPLIDDYWHEDNFPNLDEPILRSTLKELKGAAAKIVAPLLKSSLQYDGKDKLPYLTCIRVGEEDVPWQKGVKKEVDADGDEEMC